MCVIDALIKYQAKKGQKPEVLKRYLQIRYRIKIDDLVLKRRTNEAKGIFSLT